MILRRLEERHPDPPLWPADPARRAEVDVFVDWFNRVWKVAPNAIDAELARDEPDSERITALAAELRGSLGRFEALLDGRDHLLGDDLGIADVVAFPFLKYALLHDPADDERFHASSPSTSRSAAPTRASRPGSAGWTRCRAPERPQLDRATKSVTRAATPSGSSNVGTWPAPRSSAYSASGSRPAGRQRVTAAGQACGPCPPTPRVRGSRSRRTTAAGPSRSIASSRSK